MAEFNTSHYVFGIVILSTKWLQLGLKCRLILSFMVVYSAIRFFLDEDKARQEV